MKLEKLIIYSFADRNFSDSTESIEAADKKFTAPVNPESFSKNFKIDLDIRRGHGNNGTDIRFKSTVPEELRLEFILDCTGTIQGYPEEYIKKKKPDDIKETDPEPATEIMPVHEQLKMFLECVYNFQGEIHRPRFLMIIWGSEIKFRCVLSNLDVNYTLFKPDGSPLRVKLTANFLNYKARIEREAEERKSSPDLTHYRKVKQGDRLDLMTFRIYNNSKYFLQVGRANSLSRIRHIRPGTELYFPPFDQTQP